MGGESRDRLPERGSAADREAASRAEPQATLTLIRHGEPNWSPGGSASVLDPGLTPFGAAQAEATAALLAKRRFDALYVSPYLRAQQTAETVGKAIGLEPVTIGGLAEVGVAVEGVSQEDVDRYFTEASRRPLNELWDGWPGAETFHDFHRRITSGIAEILELHDCRPYREHDFTAWELPDAKPSIAIVAHGGTNAVILTHMLDIRPVPWEWIRFETGLASFSVLQARPLGPSGHVWSLRTFNGEDHLYAAGLR